jgi:hypothetical protein
MDKKLLNERDICTKFITPAIKRAGWDVMSQIREEVGFTKGRIIVRGKLVRGAALFRCLNCGADRGGAGAVRHDGRGSKCSAESPALT